jgi:hypothetical protein
MFQRDKIITDEHENIAKLIKRNTNLEDKEYIRYKREATNKHVTLL